MKFINYSMYTADRDVPSEDLPASKGPRLALAGELTQIDGEEPNLLPHGVAPEAPTIGRSAGVARTARQGAALLLERDPRFVLPSRQIRDALLIGFAMRRRVLYGAAYDLVRLAEPVDLTDPEAIAANLRLIRVYEVKATNQAKIGPDLKGYFFNLTSAELLVAQSLGEQHRFAFVNTATGHCQELTIGELWGRARAVYPSFHIKM